MSTPSPASWRLCRKMQRTLPPLEINLASNLGFDARLALNSSLGGGSSGEKSRKKKESCFCRPRILQDEGSSLQPHPKRSQSSASVCQHGARLDNIEKKRTPENIMCMYLLVQVCGALVLDPRSPSEIIRGNRAQGFRADSATTPGWGPQLWEKIHLFQRNTENA